MRPVRLPALQHTFGGGMAKIYMLPARGVEAEWYVPGFGPRKFRQVMGLLSPPHTAMVLAFTVIGSMAAPEIRWSSVGTVGLVFVLGLGIAARLFEAVSGRADQTADLVRPIWMKLLAAVSVLGALGLSFLWAGDSPGFAMVVVAECLLTAACSRNWFNGTFRSETWRAVAWGFLPVVAGYIVQTQTLTLQVCALGAAMCLFSRVVIKAGRGYAEIKQSRGAHLDENDQLLRRLKHVLTGVSMGVILLGVAAAVGRLIGA